MAEGGGWPNVGWREAYAFALMGLALVHIQRNDASENVTGLRQAVECLDLALIMSGAGSIDMVLPTLSHTLACCLVRTHRCIHTHAFLHTCTHTCAHVHTYVRTHTHMYTAARRFFPCVFPHISKHKDCFSSCIFAYAYTCTSTHARIHVPSPAHT